MRRTYYLTIYYVSLGKKLSLTDVFTGTWGEMEEYIAEEYPDAIEVIAES